VLDCYHTPPILRVHGGLSFEYSTGEMSLLAALAGRDHYHTEIMPIRQVTRLFLGPCACMVLFFFWVVPSTQSALGQGTTVDLRPLLGPVKSQGKRGTCSVHAATCLMEYLIRVKTGSSVDLSEAHNYWTAKNFTLDSAFLREAYTNIDGLAGFLAVEAYKFASMLETEWPYEPANWQQTGDPRCRVVDGKPCGECFTGLPPKDAKTLPYRINPTFVERSKLGEFLLTRRTPVVFNVAWYPDAVDQTTGAIRLPTPKEQQSRFGHVILLVGFDSSKRRFIFRNSWGAGWGDKGYGTVPEQYLIDHCEVAPYLSDLDRYPLEQKAFFKKGSMGASGELVELSSPVR